MQDCVVVSHVCHYWRELALGTPRLWCELDFFTSRHGGPCECLMCSALELDDIHRLGTTNIHLITNIIGRSLALPLHLNITAPVPRCEPDDTAYLARMLKPCIDRLVALNVKTDDPWLAGEFIQGFPSLPALRSLSYRHIDEFNYEGLFLGPVALPALQALDLTTRNILHSEFPQSEVTHFSLPSVHTLRTVVQRLEDLYTIFSACPQLQDLSVTIEHRLFATPEPASSWRGIRQRAASLRAVEICYSVPEQVAAVLAIFHDPSRS
ncbi:hypothetical protein EXIGLDRAFT_27661 [Exidia glandulosa HHB12029]|uniref:F-box domain-containing protein n=1 Tax=Exidia glandulosa HHB12029 TaxID=1314781 RepID=A0A165P9C3_EXIGL|nr:hypothetical protein EXIGLDRAFT_27661 [Exidia glandulosa HHB12029]